MHILIKKSEANVEACKALMDKGYHTGSIHHAYYAVYQFMVQFLQVEFKWQNKPWDSKSHDSAINDIEILVEQEANDIDTDIDDFAEKKLYIINNIYVACNEIRAIKRERKEADYGEKDFESGESKIQFEKAENSIKILKELQRIVRLVR